jgi:hypothetical protein
LRALALPSWPDDQNSKGHKRRILTLPPRFDGVRLCAGVGHQPQKRSKTESFKLL